MRVNRLVLATVAVMALAAAGKVTWLVTRGPGPPVVDQAQARAMTPAIDAYLASHAASLGGGLLLETAPRLKPRVFCDQVIIEIRPARPSRWKVGMQITDPIRRSHPTRSAKPGGPSDSPRHQAAQ